MKKVLIGLMVSFFAVSSSFASWTIDDVAVYNATGTGITTCTDTIGNIGLSPLASSDLMDTACGNNFTSFAATDEVSTSITSMVTGTFTSLGELIVSPLGGLIIFGLAIGYLFFAKKMASSRNARR